MRWRAGETAILALALSACATTPPRQKVFEAPRPALPGSELAFSGPSLTPEAGSCRRREEMTGWADAALVEELQRAGYKLKPQPDRTTPQLVIGINRLEVSPCSWVAAQFLGTHARVALSVTLNGQDGATRYQRSLEGADDLPAGVHDAARLAIGNAAADAMHFVTRDAAFTAAMADLRESSITP